MSSLVADGSLQPGESSSLQTIGFFVPGRWQFTYDLVFFATLNQAPRMATVPDVEAISGHLYVYDVGGFDADGDELTFSLAAAPAGMAVTSATGRITWSPTSTDVGTHTVIVQVEDGRGGSTHQRYDLSVIEPPPNRPPLFASLPVVSAHVNTPYSYQATAEDPDGDPLTYSLGEAVTTAVVVTNSSFECRS